MHGSKYLMEGLPDFLSSPIFTRVIIPGLYAVVLLNPFYFLILSNLSKTHSIPPLLLLVVFSAMTGAVLQAIDKQIYYAYEGFSYWPSWLVRYRVKRHRSRIKKLLSEAEQCEENKKETKCDLIWEKLLIYPLDEKGEPHAICPTLLGNVLASYEEYPFSRYGVDAVFYWPRLWMLLDKEVKWEITNKWARADCWVYLATITLVAIILYSLTFIGSWFGIYELSKVLKPLVHTDTGLFQFIILVALVFLRSFCYKRAIMYHTDSGDSFKAILDIHIYDLLPKMKINTAYNNKLDSIWSYLQYLRIKCQKCGHHYRISLSKCEECNEPTGSNLKNLE